MARLMKSKKAEGIMGMSFGTIFSILLMIFFIAVAFMVIKHFLGIQDCAKIGLFWNDLQDEVDKTWYAQSVTSTFNGIFPNDIKYVCFGDLSKSIKGNYKNIGEELSIYEGEKADVFLYPINAACEMPYKLVNHLDISGITAIENPYCIEVSSGKISIKIKKGFNERLVSLNK